MHKEVAKYLVDLYTQRRRKSLLSHNSNSHGFLKYILRPMCKTSIENVKYKSIKT